MANRKKMKYGQGAVMSDAKRNEKRRNNKKDGKVGVRLRKGTFTRYTVPWLLSASTVKFCIQKNKRLA